MIDLYKKNIWNDQKTVNVIATACICKTTKASSILIKAFWSKNNFSIIIK